MEDPAPDGDNPFLSIARIVSRLMARGAGVEEVQAAIRGLGVREDFVETTQLMIGHGCIAAHSVAVGGEPRESGIRYLLEKGLAPEDVEGILDVCMEAFSEERAESEADGEGEASPAAAAQQLPPGWDDPVPPDLKFDFSSPEAALRSIEDAYRAGSYRGVLACKDFDLEAQFMANQHLARLKVAEYKKMRIVAGIACRAFFHTLLREGMPEWKGVRVRITEHRRISPTLSVLTEELALPAGETLEQKTFVGKGKDGWKVLMTYCEEMERAWLEGLEAVRRVRERTRGG